MSTAPRYGPPRATDHGIPAQPGHHHHAAHRRYLYRRRPALSRPPVQPVPADDHDVLIRLCRGPGRVAEPLIQVVKCPTHGLPIVMGCEQASRTKRSRHLARRYIRRGCCPRQHRQAPPESRSAPRPPGAAPVPAPDSRIISMAQRCHRLPSARGRAVPAGLPVKEAPFHAARKGLGASSMAKVEPWLPRDGSCRDRASVRIPQVVKQLEELA